MMSTLELYSTYEEELLEVSELKYNVIDFESTVNGIVFLILGLSVYRNMIDFLHIFLVPCKVTESIYYLQQFFVDSLGFCR